MVGQSTGGNTCATRHEIACIRCPSLAVSKRLPTPFLLVSERHFFRQRSDHPRPTLAAKSTTGTAINEVGRIVTVSPALEVAAGGVVELDVGNGTFHIDDDSGLAGRDRVVDRR